MIPQERPPRSRLRPVIQAGLVLAVLAVAGALAFWMIESAPKAKKRRPVQQAALVEVLPATIIKERVTIQVMGTVRPSRQVELHPRVKGELIELSDKLIPGGLFRDGDRLMRLDPVDYRLAVKQAQSVVAQAKASLRMERGNQLIARKEYEMLGQAVGGGDQDLMLRKPQLETVEATLDSAKAALDKARLDLKRTTIKAPFNAIILDRGVNVGSWVTESTPLATLAGTDAYWVEAAVPVDKLAYIALPREGQQGASARIIDEAAWPQGGHREGRVIRLAADLEEQGRMAKLLVEVSDPLSLEDKDQPRLIIGSYVRVEVEGHEIGPMVALSRSLVHGGNTVWVMDPQGQLDIRPVEIAYKGHNKIYISQGVREGERVVSTDLPAPVQGMSLRLRGEEPTVKGESPRKGDRT